MAGPTESRPTIGQFPPPTRTLVHLSDPHILGTGQRLYGSIDTLAALSATLDGIEASGLRPDALIFTGDLADTGDRDAYIRLRERVDPLAQQWDAAVIWVNGNHDEPGTFLDVMVDGTAAQLNRVIDVGGLRVIALSTALPDRHDGALGETQLAWLADILATPAPMGTVIAMHHPPIPSVIGMMSLLELRGQEAFADVIRGSDVRCILAGHLHYATHSSVVNIPVSVAAATCYTLDPLAAYPGARAQAGGRSWNLVTIHDDRVVHTTVPATTDTTLFEVDAQRVNGWIGLPPEVLRAAMESGTE